MSSTDEIEIKQALAQKLPGAYERLFRTYFSMLTIFADKMLHDLDLSQDVVQEVFIKVYEQKDRLHLKSSIQSFLFQSVKNKCIDQIRSQKTRYAHQEYILKTTSEELVEDYVEQTEFEAHVYQCISGLPDQCQLIFKMNRFEGKKNQEIADELSISKRTVETQISKALKKLRVDVYEYLKTIVLLISALIENIL